MGRAGRFAAPDLASGNDLAVARQPRPRAGCRACRQHLLVRDAVATVVPGFAVAAALRTGFLGVNGREYRGDVGALRFVLLGRAEAGNQTLTIAVVLLSGGLDSMVCAALA